ncbi:MAG: hypothetical protein QM741_12875 [Rudaea sp.]|uniref:hypothetical protein n=1 Tax=Rudaea sp. TaxID=2136325 RepID=UPI0039E2D0D5
MTGTCVPPPRSNATDPLPVSPGLGDVMTVARVPRKSVQLDRRVLLVSTIAILLATACALIAQWLTALIGIVTNLAFYGRWSTGFVSPAGNDGEP